MHLIKKKKNNSYIKKMEDAINYAMEWYEKKKKNEDMEAPADSKTLLEKVGGEE